MRYSQWLQQFIDVYSTLGTDNLETLEAIYHPEVTFIDPLHEVRGRKALLHSFAKSYANILECRFVVDHAMESQEEAALYWEMTFRHKQLNGQMPIVVTGHSHLKQMDGRVIFHRDYLDLGVMLYEQVPLLGSIIKGIKKRAVR